MKLIDMRQPNGELYPQAIFDAVMDSCNPFPRAHMEQFNLDLLHADGHYYTYAELETMGDVTVLTPAQVLGRTKFDDLMIGRAKHQNPSVSMPEIKTPIGMKLDHNKPRYDLIPVNAEAEMVDVLTFGATKYGAENWRHVDNARNRYIAAALRHIAAYRKGEQMDSESGKHHLAHAMCCMAFIAEMDLTEAIKA